MAYLMDLEQIKQEIYYLYEIENIINGKKYIGYTNNPRLRQKAHFVWKNSGSILVEHAIKKYGLDSLRFKILVKSDNEVYIKDLEIAAISSLNTKAPQGYNLTDGGEGTRGLTLSDNQKADRSKNMKGKMIGEKNPFYGKKHDPETLKRMVETRRKNGSYVAWNKGGGHKLSAKSRKSLRENRPVGGTKNPNAKLTEEKVREIYNLKGQMTGEKVVMFLGLNVSGETVRRIWNRTTWSSLVY